MVLVPKLRLELVAAGGFEFGWLELVEMKVQNGEASLKIFSLVSLKLTAEPKKFWQLTFPPPLLSDALGLRQRKR